ncbi:Alkyl hydroperoxide reductase/Thiol-disulfide oxidoreductase [Thermobacillus xylanilyticus]|uniref:Alkyl hydroperoxide reductase/Thiol-disulfide oxidoreductase n=1 Tax=Thermobacillus xylanilyticus TaxID=76633 RepID=A0ABN7S349_THEXY|nr:TlpA disulfide reductase family protein [Thermobacillus xylanilyticus]CAG5088358.1 Alkyl hydroperoxide reductase/Thiol-disulfide oxidoreductase [Thermobacillus xylanilyticus]
MKRAWSMAVVIVILTILAVYQNQTLTMRSSAAAEVKPKIGYLAPSFELPDLSDRTVRAGGASDKLTMINFWASWCGPCDLEAPDLQELHERHADRLLLIGVNSTKYDRERDARRFVEEHELTFPILMDRKGNVTELYKVSQFPTTLLVDKDGVIRERVVGVLSKTHWEALIDKWS